MKKRLLDNHPVVQKFNELMDTAHKLGLSLYFESGVCILHVEGDQTKYRIEDIEDPDHNNEFPPVMDFKITFGE